MSETLLKEIVSELKELRHGTNQRLDELSKKVDGLNQSVVVLQQGVAPLRYDVNQIKEILAEKVIWQNDSVSLETKEGKTIYGIIHRESRKRE